MKTTENVSRIFILIFNKNVGIKAKYLSSITMQLHWIVFSTYGPNLII